MARAQLVFDNTLTMANAASEEIGTGSAMGVDDYAEIEILDSLDGGVC